MEIEQIMSHVFSIQQTSLDSRILFEFEHNGPTDILTDDERAMSICFISRYEHCFCKAIFPASFSEMRLFSGCSTSSTLACPT
jgi:hypothetical protein